MKKYLVVYFLLLFTAVLLAQRVTIQPIYPGGSGGITTTNTPSAGYYLTTDGSVYYWALVSASSTNLPPYALTNSQAVPFTIGAAYTNSSNVAFNGTLQVFGGPSAKIESAGRNYTSFLHNTNTFTNQGYASFSTNLYLGTNIFLLGKVSEFSINDIARSDAPFTAESIDGAVTVGYATGPNYVQLLGPVELPFSTASRALVLDAAKQITTPTGTPDGTKFLRDDNTYAVPALSSAALTNNQTTATTISNSLRVSGAITNSSLATNAILVSGPGGIITTGIIGANLSLAADGTLSATGGGGGGASGMSYITLPASGIVGGTDLAYSTNLSSDITLTASNLLSTNRYFVQWESAGHKVTFANSAAWRFTDSGRGGYSESTTNAGLHELQIWKDAVSGQTNALYHGPEYAVIIGWGLAAATNNITRAVTITQTNRPSGIATNATSFTTDFSDTANIQVYNVGWHLTTNLVISPTNLVTGRTLEVYFQTNSLSYDVTVTNTAANAVRWNFNTSTNGSTSFTKTNTLTARLFLTAETNGVIVAELGYYR